MIEPISNPIDPDAVRLKISEITALNLPGFERKEILKKIFSFIDLTTLEGSDNDGTITALCGKAKAPASSGLPVPAAVCVYPPFVRLAKTLLTGTGIKVASWREPFPAVNLHCM